MSRDKASDIPPNGAKCQCGCTTCRPTAPSATVTGGVIVARAYPLLEERVEQGIGMGWRRFWKHRDHIAPDTYLAMLNGTGADYHAFIDAITNAVMDSVCEAFDFPESFPQA